MHIGVDASCWLNHRGYGRHARALLAALTGLDGENHYTFVMDSAEAPSNLPAGVQVKLVSVTAPTAVAASAMGHRSAKDLWRMSRALSDPSFDMLLFPTVYSYVPVFCRAKKVVMIHDVIADKHPHLTLPSRLSRIFWKAKGVLGRHQADAVATVSEYSRHAIAEHFRIPKEKIFVVGEAGDPVFRPIDGPTPTAHLASLGIQPNRRSVVYVGGFNPHKNLEALVRAFARLAGQPEFSDLKLVMVGEREKEVFHSYYSTIERQVIELGLVERVLFTGYLPDDELVVLLNLATVLALPSLMEGFGLPAVEAAACGCPVIATSASPLPQLLGEGGLYVDPLDDEQLAAALTRVLRSEDLRRQMRQAGLQAAGSLTWDAAAHQMMALLRQVAVR